MTAIILCAGFAMRMHPLTKKLPKPLLEVAGRPVIDYLIDQIIRLPGMGDIHVVTNARFYERFDQWHRQQQPLFESHGRRLVLHNDGAMDNATRRGASADLQFVLKTIVEPSSALVSAGDNIYLFPIKPLWGKFSRSDAHQILVLPETDPKKLSHSGVPLLGERDRVLRIYEKPERPLFQGICPPLYFLKPSAWPVLDRFLETDANPDAPGHFIDYLCRMETVYAVKLAADRLHIGDMEAYRAADRLLRRHTCPNFK